MMHVNKEHHLTIQKRDNEFIESYKKGSISSSIEEIDIAHKIVWNRYSKKHGMFCDKHRLIPSVKICIAMKTIMLGFIEPLSLSINCTI